MKNADHSVADLIWGEENKLFEGLGKTIPIWALSRIGYGSGYGYGDGCEKKFKDLEII